MRLRLRVYHYPHPRARRWRIVAGALWLCVLLLALASLVWPMGDLALAWTAGPCAAFAYAAMLWSMVLDDEDEDKAERAEIARIKEARRAR